MRDRSRAVGALRAINFVVPALAGLLIAWFVLRWGRPYEARSDYFAWLGAAICSSLLVSSIAGMLLGHVTPHMKLFRRSSNFDAEIRQRFRATLRAGNTKSMIRSGTIDLSADEQMEHLLTLLEQLSRHDRLTRGHSERVRAYSTLIGQELEFTESQLDRLSWSALLHDAGKLDVPESILNSPNRPTEDEWAIITQHPAKARAHLEPLEPTFGNSIYDAAECHHERWDGTGYPAGISGEEIPLFGRIVCVADAFDVMTHARSYKVPFSIEDARSRLLESSGTQFDPRIVDAFLRIGEPKLTAVRGLAATVAGLSIAGSSALVATSAQAVVAAGAVIGAAVVTEQLPPADPPAAIAFADATTTAAPTTTTTTTAAPTTTTAAAPTTTSTTTTTIEVVNTISPPPRLFSINYTIGSIEQDGQRVTVRGDRLDVFVDGALDQSIAMAPDQSAATVVLDMSDTGPGFHRVRFDLYDGDKLVSTDETVISV